MKTEKSTQKSLQANLAAAGFAKEKLAATMTEAYLIHEGYAEVVKDDLAAEVEKIIRAMNLTKENLATTLAEVILLQDGVVKIVEDDRKIPPDLMERCTDDIMEIFKDSMLMAIAAAVKAETLTKEDMITGYKKANQIIREQRNEIAEENLALLTFVPNTGECRPFTREEINTLLNDWNKNQNTDEVISFFSQKFINLRELAMMSIPEARYVILFDNKWPEWRGKLLKIAESQFGKNSLEYGTLNFYFASEKCGCDFRLDQKEIRH